MSNRKLALPIIDLSCGGRGTALVERAIAKLPGVANVYVNPATEMAYVGYLPGQLSAERIAQAVRDGGYRAAPPAKVLQTGDREGSRA